MSVEDAAVAEAFSGQYRACTVCGLVLDRRTQATHVVWGAGERPMMWYECDMRELSPLQCAQHLHPDDRVVGRMQLDHFWEQLEADLERKRLEDSAGRVQHALLTRTSAECTCSWDWSEATRRREHKPECPAFGRARAQ